MHTDRKIGFAMGILLIGIVAALFFRNEPLISTKVPAIRREQELNQRLREQNAAVYLNDTTPEDATEQPAADQKWTLRDVLKRMDERNKTAPVPVGSKGFAQQLDDIDEEDLDGYRPRKRKSSNDVVATDSSVPELKSNTEPSPENSEPSQFGKLPPLMPVERPSTRVAVADTPTLDAPPARTDHPSLSESTDEFQPPETFEEYVVKYGDTLSGIAYRTLGSSAKYMDIYNANRDRMASPDRLTVGKPLRIPRPSSSERATNQRSPNNDNPSL